MTTDNDIVERLRALSRCEHSDLSVGDEAAAEIGRLRGEVEALRQWGIKYLWWLGVKDAENGLRKDMADPEMVDRPAPAMPNGVEGLMQLARNWCLAWGEWAHDADPGGAKENAAEAALRAALTTALAKPPAEAFDPSIHPIPGEGQQPAMLNGVEEAEEVLRSALGIARKINQDESGDEWLNLSADLLRLLQKALSPRVGLTIFRAADNRDAAGVDSEEDAYVIERMGKMLAEIAVIVNGPEPDMTRWSYHDLPEKVRALKTAPAAVPAGEAVAYLDIGVGGYLDLGTEKDADELFKLPPGRHMLGIIGTYGVDGYKANPPAAEAPAPMQAAPQAAQVQGVAAYDRELIARMLDDHARGIWVTFTPDAMREQAALLRDADNAEAAGVHTAHPSACELGAVREALDHAEGRLAHYSLLNPRDTELSCAILPMVRRAKVALQHRGDSRGGEG